MGEFQIEIIKPGDDEASQYAAGTYACKQSVISLINQMEEGDQLIISRTK